MCHWRGLALDQHPAFHKKGLDDQPIAALNIFLLNQARPHLVLGSRMFVTNLLNEFCILANHSLTLRFGVAVAELLLLINMAIN